MLRTILICTTSSLLSLVLLLSYQNSLFQQPIQAQERMGLIPPSPTNQAPNPNQQYFPAPQNQSSQNQAGQNMGTNSQLQLQPPQLQLPGLQPPTPLQSPSGNPQFVTPAQDPEQLGISGQEPIFYTQDELVSINVYERVNRSVVNITTESVSQDLLFEYSSEGAGSGAVIDKQGNILTNYHVVKEARHVNVTLYDGSSHEASFVGADPINDIAIIRIDAKPEVLWPVVFGDSSNLKVGQRVFAIGNPFGFERTLSVGIISSLNRSLKLNGNRKISSIIQIDASLNPGNSGGPLLDSRGYLIGVNTAIASTSRAGQSAGVGFAIPVNMIKRVAPQLLKHGKFIRPDIGISRVYQTDNGLMIERMTPGGPAERAGVKGPQIVKQRRGPFTVEKIVRTSADTIIALDEKPVKTADEFLDLIEVHKPGDIVKMTVMRDSKNFDITIQLGGEEPMEATPTK
jgi:S1-C subfamily serine protease